MKHHATPNFWSLYNSLPPEIQRKADRAYGQLKQNPRHPSLHFKRIGRLWSVRVGAHHRALAVEAGQDLVWFWIGTHAEYDKGGSEETTAPTELILVQNWFEELKSLVPTN